MILRLVCPPESWSGLNESFLNRLQGTVGHAWEKNCPQWGVNNDPFGFPDEPKKWIKTLWNMAAGMVGVTGLEPAASSSRTRRATNCATPRKTALISYSASWLFRLREELIGQKSKCPSSMNTSLKGGERFCLPSRWKIGIQQGASVSCPSQTIRKRST